MSKNTDKQQAFLDRLATVGNNWTPPASWVQINTIDAHTEGEPLRIVFAGFPELPGDHVLQRRRIAGEHFDLFRRALMWEPRGHADMYGCLVVPPNQVDTDPADFAVLFLHNEGYSSMCGHGIIAVTKIAIETGLVSADGDPTTIKIDAPAGRITAYASIRGESVVRTSFDNVPSFVVSLDQTVAIQGLGHVSYDLAFGGAYYAYVDAKRLGISLETSSVNQLIDIGMKIKNEVQNTVDIQHPIHDDLSFLYGTIFIGEAVGDNHSRNVCIFADGEVDRSPTGTGVSGRAAIHHARGELQLGEEITIESILGTTFSVSATKLATIGGYDGIVPRVSGRAFVTGKHSFMVDPNDPLGHGFLLR